MGACRAHYFLQSKPAWIFLIGASGSGKTEIGIRALEGLPDTYELDDLSTKAFITAKKGKSGILHRLREDHASHHTGILLAKDFSSFLGKRPEDRADIAQQLRHIADGYWSKDTGEHGHQSWRGKITFIAACTPALETAWATMRALGDRFITLRWREPDDRKSGAKSQLIDGHDDEVATTIKSFASNLFGKPAPTPPPAIPDDFAAVLLELALLTAWLRTTIICNDNGKIIDVGTRERPNRIIRAIRIVMSGCAALEHREVIPNDLWIAHRLAFDSVPPRYRQIIDLLPDGVEVGSGELWDCLPQQGSRKTLVRNLHALEAIGVIELRGYSDEDQFAGKSKLIAILTEEFSRAREAAITPFKSTGLVAIK